MKYMTLTGHDDNLDHYTNLPDILNCYDLDLKRYDLSEIQIFISDKHHSWPIVSLMFPNRVIDSFHPILKNVFDKTNHMFHNRNNLI